MVRSSRNSLAVALVLIASSVPLSAHRKDEYLQAARLGIDPDRVQIELDLTPGIAVAEEVLAAIDLNRDGALSPSERAAYVGTVLRGITLDVDGRPLRSRVIGSEFPATEAVRRGEGTIRLRIAAVLPSLEPGVHRVRYGNAYRSDVGAYLANALVPAGDRIVVTDQQRDVDQRELRVAYRLRPASDERARVWPTAVVLCGLMALAVITYGGSRRSPGRTAGAAPMSAPTRSARRGPRLAPRT
jgi:hypothetical protein